MILQLGRCKKCGAEPVPVIDVLGDGTVFLCARCLENLHNIFEEYYLYDD